MNDGKGTGLVFTVDLALGPNGELRGMRTGCMAVGLGAVPKATMERIGVKFQRVVEAELFTEDRIRLPSGRDS